MGQTGIDQLLHFVFAGTIYQGMEGQHTGLFIIPLRLGKTIWDEVCERSDQDISQCIHDSRQTFLGSILNWTFWLIFILAVGLQINKQWRQYLLVHLCDMVGDYLLLLHWRMGIGLKTFYLIISFFVFCRYYVPYFNRR